MMPPKIVVTPARWGWQLEGNEEIFTRIIAETFRPGFSYLEIGIGQCGTMRAVCQICEQLGEKFSIAGVDLPTDPFGNRKIAPDRLRKWWDRVRIVFMESPEALAADLARSIFDVVFIDACHCKEHTLCDFLAVEPHIGPGGFIIFHDASPLCQNKELQWDGKPVQVRDCMASLGLLDDSRPPWRLRYDLANVKNGIAAIRRT